MTYPVGQTIQFLDRIADLERVAKGILSGFAQIDPGQTSVAFVYDTQFLGTLPPNVVAVAVDDDPSALGGMWITNQGASGGWTGFTINITNAPSTSPAVTAYFSYVVIG